MSDTPQSPLISVIVLTYNQEATIARTIESIVNQRCEYPYEIIIADDCSTDATSNICSHYAEKYPTLIRFVKNKKNKGLIDNYYDSLLSAKGKYIADCAGDDYWVDTLKLQKQTQILEKYPDVSLVHAGWNYIDSCTQQKIDRKSHSGKLNYRQPFLNGRTLMIPYITAEESPVPIVHISTALFRKDIFIREYQNNPDIFRNKDYKCEDVQIITTMMANGTIAFIPDIVLNYTVGHSSISSAENLIKAFDFYFGTLSLRLRLIDMYDLSEALQTPHFKEIIYYVLSLAFRSGSSERMHKIISTIKENHIKMPIKKHMYKWLSTNKALWNTTLHLLKVIKR